ncbi:hypothetical protein Lal_00018706 [Lupinus albus]|nr:hypothetical protein Lal_00018706 [Lupinus albus]
MGFVDDTVYGRINNCKLFLDTLCTRAVAIGTVYNTQNAMIHHAQIPSNHWKVSIDLSIEDDALLPIPIDENIITVRLALATFVAWPKHLIDVVPIMGKVSADDHSATSPPRIDELASKKAKGVKSKSRSSKSNLESSGENLPADSTINISHPEPIYGFPSEEFITINDVKDVHGRDWIGASVLSVYIRTLNTYRSLNPKRQRAAKWIHVKEVIKQGKAEVKFDVETYTVDQIDVNRKIWSKFVYSFRTESTDNL